MATHFSILAWEIPWTEEPGRLYSMGSQTVRQTVVTKQQRQLNCTIKNCYGSTFYVCFTKIFTKVESFFF